MTVRPPNSRGRDHLVLAAIRVELLSSDRLAPHAPLERRDQVERRTGLYDPAAGDDGHVRTQVGHVLDDVRREDHDHVLADLGQQVEEAVALLGIEAGGRLVDDDQRGSPSSACAMPKRCRMPPEKPAERSACARPRG